MKILLLSTALLTWILTTTVAQNVPNYVPINGLIGFWPFCGNTNDLSGNNYHAINNGANLVPDRLGNSNCAYRFNGSSSYMTTPVINQLNNVQNATFSVWVKVNGNNIHCGNPSGDDSKIICRGSDWQSDFINLSAGGCSLSSGQPIFGGSIGRIFSMIGVGTPITYPRPTQWLNIVWTIGSGFQRLYINGVLSNSTPYTGIIPSSSSGLTFGYMPNWGYPLNGDLDDIGIWNRSLTQQEITALYNGTNCVPPVATVTAAGPTSFCSGGSVQLNTLANPAYTYQWQNNGVNISGATNASYTANAAGSYTVIVRSSADCADTSAPTAITVNPFLTPTFTAVGPYCSGTTIPALPTNSTNGIVGNWSPSINNTVTSVYTFAPLAGQCANPATITISINPKSTLSINASIIQGQSYNFNGQVLSTAGTYTWTGSNAAGCDSVVTLILSINPPPLNCVIEASATEICSGRSVVLTASISGGGSGGSIPPYLQQGLMAFYPFDGNANDLSNNHNNPNLSTIQYGPDRYGQPGKAGYFYGNEYAIVPNSPSFFVENAFSVSFWYFVNSNFPTDGWWNTKAVFTKNNDYPYGAVVFMGPGIDSIGLGLGTDSWNSYKNFGKNIPRSSFVNGWHHVVMLYDGSLGKIYFDGELISEKVCAPSWGSANNLDLHIGVNGDPNGWYPYKFQGRLDDLGFWNRSLSLEEIQQLSSTKTYIWSNGATTESITVSPTESQTYSCTISNGSQTCSTSVAITVNPRPIVSAGPDVSVAKNSGSITLQASPAGGTWSGQGISSNGVFNPVLETGVYPATYCFTNSQSCTSCDTALVTVSNPLITAIERPIISPGTGTYSNPITVSISCSTPGVTVYYTTTGNVPIVGTTFTRPYTGPFQVLQSTTIRAMAVLSGLPNSKIDVAFITILNSMVAANPVISPGTGTYTGPQTISISSSTPGASIYYTTNGNQPLLGTPNTFTKLYNGPFIQNTSATIRAIAVKTGLQNSGVTLASLTITSASVVVATPVITPGTGSFIGPLGVSISCTTPGATIYYTTNGNTPRLDIANSFTKIYGGPFSLTGTGSRTIRAIATAPGQINSVVAVANLTLSSGSRAAFGEEEQEPEPGIRVYPNPSSGLFYVEVPRRESEMKFSILSTDGRMVGSGTLHPHIIGIIDLSCQPKGLYLIKVQDNHQIHVLRITKL
jgi:hypothetical protein